MKRMKCSAPKTCDLDAVPTSLPLDCGEVVAPHVMETINLSLSTGTVRDSYKLAIVSALLKKQDKMRTILKDSDLFQI